jgi:hypothetical protein
MLSSAIRKFHCQSNTSIGHKKVPAQQTQLQTTTVYNVRPGQPALYLWDQPLLKANRPNPYLSWSAGETPLVHGQCFTNSVLTYAPEAPATPFVPSLRVGEQHRLL